MNLELIVAVDSEWGIGKNGELLTKIPADMKNFRRITLGRTVILGRKTLSGFPNSKPLEGRKNIILSANPSISAEDGAVVRSLEEALAICKNEAAPIVIGGGEIYRMFLPYCKRAYVTKLYKDFNADVFFENLDKAPDWKNTLKGDIQSFEDISFSFDIYERAE